MFESYNFDMKLGNVRDILGNSAVLRAVVDPSFLNLIADVTVEALPEEGPMIGHNPDLETIKKLVDEINKTVDDESVKKLLNRLVWPMVGEGQLNTDTFEKNLSIIAELRKRYPVIDKVLDLLLSWPGFVVQGSYDPFERKIVIYECQSLQDVEKRRFCFGHECFHAYHFHELEKKTGAVHFDGCPCKVKIVVESLAAYYELKTAEACGDTQYRDRRIDELRKYHVFLFPYSGALQISGEGHFQKIFRSSIDQGVDDAYDLFIHAFGSCDLRKLYFSNQAVRTRKKRKHIRWIFKPVNSTPTPTKASKSVVYIVHIYMYNGTTISWAFNSNLDPKDEDKLKNNIRSWPIYRNLNHSGRLSDVDYILVEVPKPLPTAAQGGN